MSNLDNHTGSWSDADIQRYLKGELSPREMHALEKAALDDPFLADALEGLQEAAVPGAAGEPALSADLDELRSRLDRRISEKQPSTAIPWFRRPALRVAAAVILLLGVGLSAYYTVFRKAPAEAFYVVKKTTPPPVAAPPAAAPADTSIAAAAVPDLALASKDNEVEKATPPRIKRRKAATAARATDSTVNFGEGFVRTDSSVAAKYNNSDLAVARDQASPQPGLAITPRSMPPGTLRSVTLHKELYTPSPLQFSGRVVDAQNRPLAGASVFLKNTNAFDYKSADKAVGVNGIGTTTDAQGYFNLKVPGKDTTRQTTVSLIGYQPADYVLHSETADNVIRLQEAKHSMDEVVVVGYGSKRKEMMASVPTSSSEERLDSNWIRVYPLPGRLVYEQYLSGVKKTLAVDTTIHGTERISFLVDQKGKISDYRIEQSLSPVHDAGLMQAITNGPAWKLLHGRKARAVVSMNFP